MTDKRPDPKPRKNPHLWQTYLFWNELVEVRKRHNLRISSIEAGKSNLDAQIEKDFMTDMQADNLIDTTKKMMVREGKALGQVWDWITSIRGLKEGSLAAQLLAQIDDIGKFDTVSKLWRFSGQAVIDGVAERNAKGEKSHYNRKLKSICWLVVDQFIKQQTPLYVDIYYAEKLRLRTLYPTPIENPRKDSRWPQAFTDSHVHRMAMRKVAKIFLQHIWVVWRTYEGLPISEPYVQAILKHTDIIPPPNM